MRIVVLCGAGASSTFVAQRLRTALDARAIAHTAEPASLSALPGCLDGADLLLLGPHLADRQDDLLVDAAARGTRVAVLPPDIYGDLDGARTLEIVRQALTAETDDDHRVRADRREETR
ncbi:PTS sugar transporter [Microbacterium sp. KUDC0406]|uniref:PTS sugar transporter subunit IIB n=1 Tax=Microbacterium sp. KUDC0406 TaxID=2909588 RepID=UPI001F3766C3|nr:PTS sugar transporter [Microbacterium sp. KUDC0406]UJP08864.1 PTS sugar transporter [Microbacterium sp. KUDC0406]